MISDMARGGQRRWLLFVALAYLFALFTAFAAVVSAAIAWLEYRQRQWPSASARIERCEVKPYQRSTGRRLPHSAYFVACEISYKTAHAQMVTATIHSRRIASPERTWPDTGPRIAQMQSWVDQHPVGATIEVHYDPANPRHALLTSTDMPLGGPQTADNVKVLLFFAGVCGLLSLIGRVLRPAVT